MQTITIGTSCLKTPALETEAFLQSMVFAFLDALDESSPYNSKHASNMVNFARNFIAWQERTGTSGSIHIENPEAFFLCIWLHDIGKLGVPGEVMDKGSRLGTRIRNIQDRFRVISLLDEMRAARGEMTKEEADNNRDRLNSALDNIAYFNKKPLIKDDDLTTIEEIACNTFLDEGGQRQPWLKQTEVESLSVRRGTLTKAERMAIERHVIETEVILSHVKFPDEYREVPIWAKKHHEFLDGSGYPNHLKAEHIPPEVRLLTIIDIFEALTAKNRPYKQGMSPQKALCILWEMANEGKLDADILKLFEISAAWE